MNRVLRLPATAWELLLSPPAGVAAVLLFTFALYASSLNDWFLAGDSWFLRRSQTTDWGTWLVQTLDFRDPKPIPEFAEYRPLYVLTFRAEYSLFGLHAAPYHAFNLAVHLGCVVLLWMLALRFTQRVWAAHLAALIFGAHFAYGDAVRWVINGNTPLAVFCYLAALLLFIRYTDGRPRRFWYYGGFLIALAAALLYHAETMPIVAAIIAWYFLLYRRPFDALRPRSWLPFVPVALVFVPYLVLEGWVYRNYPPDAPGLRLPEMFQIGWHMYDNYIDYFSLSAYPVDLQDSTAPYVAAVMLTFCGFLLSQWRWSLLGVFAVVWYLSSLAPVSTLTLGAYGRLLYLPGLPLSLVVTAVAMRLADIASAGEFRFALAPFRRVLPYLGLAAVVVGALLVWKLQAIGSRTSFGIDNTVGKQSDANHQLVSDLRRQLPALPQGGTLYVANPPFNLIIFTDLPLQNLVWLYYPDVDVRSVPLKDPPYWNEAQVQAALRPQDRLFVFERGR